MCQPEKRKPAGGTAGSQMTVDWKSDGLEHSPPLPDAQRRLALKLAASSGLGLSVCLVLLTLAGIGGHAQ